MGQFVVKHFKRSRLSSDAKELVTEIVVENSDTGRFLHRMEDSRLTRPCFQTIDMRDRVAGECCRYAFNDRIHYLDEISLQMFEQGLRANAGVFTVGTFEAIMGGAHTLQAQQSSCEHADRRHRESQQRRLERAQASAREPGGEDIELSAAAPPADTENAQMLPLGYFRKRVHPRLLYACPVTLEHANERNQGISRDISVSGLRVHVKGLTALRVGQDISVSFRDLPTVSGEADAERVPYRIVSIEVREAETAVCLQRTQLHKPTGFSKRIETMIEQHQRKYKLDPEDEYQSVLSWLYERSYTQSTSQVPLYVERTEAGELCVQAVAMSESNAQLLRFFCTDADNYNFTPLCLPQRLRQLDAGGSYVLAMYRQRGEHDHCMRIHSAADIEYGDTGKFQRFVAYALQQAEHCIVKVHAGAVPALAIADKKIDEVSQRLQYKSETQMMELRARLQRLRLVGCMVDMTGFFSTAVKLRGGLGDTDLLAWVGGELRRLNSGEVIERAELADEFLRPDLIRFGYVERRREDRYLAETRVEIRLAEKSFNGMSKDISTRGMRIQLEQQADVKPGTTLRVGLVSLQQKKSATNLMDIPYRVVNTCESETGTVLMLERILGGKQEGLKEFFVELITKNQHKLGVDVGDIWGATVSRVYESLLAMNAPGIPFFLARNQEGGAHLQFVGVPESGSPLLEYFRVNDALDFRWLNEARMVTALYDAVQIQLRLSRNTGEAAAPFELEVYLYKEHDELKGETFIHAASELDFSSEHQRNTFLEQFATFTDWRCVRVVAGFSQPLDENTVDRAIEPVREQAKHRAIRLSDLVHSLVGYGELIDISSEWAALRGLSR
jgi:c-di-GMP-binding flagellar brake protein YcgR